MLAKDLRYISEVYTTLDGRILHILTAKVPQGTFSISIDGSDFHTISSTFMDNSRNLYKVLEDISQLDRSVEELVDYFTNRRCHMNLTKGTKITVKLFQFDDAASYTEQWCSYILLPGEVAEVIDDNNISVTLFDEIAPYTEVFTKRVHPIYDNKGEDTGRVVEKWWTTANDGGYIVPRVIET